MFRISNKNKRTIVFITYTKQKWYQNQTKIVARSLPNIGRRTQSDRTADGIRSDCVRVTVRKAYDRNFSCLTNVIWQSYTFVLIPPTNYPKRV